MTKKPSEGKRNSAAVSRIRLRYFDEILPVEFESINRRRQQLKRGSIQPLVPISNPDMPPFGNVEGQRASGDPQEPSRERSRPRPIPCNATGLSLSGGGVRSAAVCLGALQALEKHKVIEQIDYLSTVSGGGYIGSCLTAAMTQPEAAFPFGEDVSDSPAVAHLRNYSNYLMPRGHSGIRNFAEATAVILRGLLGNIILVLTILLFCALLTRLAYPTFDSLTKGSLVLNILLRGTQHGLWQLLNFETVLRRALSFFGWTLTGLPSIRAVLHDPPQVVRQFFAVPFSLTIITLAFLSIVLVVWAVLRSRGSNEYANDVDSSSLSIARVLIVSAVVLVFVELQPFAIRFLDVLYGTTTDAFPTREQGFTIVTILLSFGAGVSIVSSGLGQFLKVTERNKDWKTALLRGATQVSIIAGATILPIAIWISYLYLSAWAITGGKVYNPFGFTPNAAVWIYSCLFAVFALIALLLHPNAYTLHRFYRDRLSKAFLFVPSGGEEPKPLDNLKLSQLSAKNAPYQSSMPL